MENRIRLLNPHVAERIAAGEVIERPASVVKELVENSLDAEATEITVLLEDGGKALIEILDNGHGMSGDDLALCIERHATSKLSCLEDLEKIHTLGFRGEALPSIAAVSDLSIISRSKNSNTAYELNANDIAGRLERKPIPQKATFGQFINASHGTRIQARSIFSQIPARLKFLKSQSAEVAQVREWMERLALAHPQVGFRLVSDDRTVLNLRPQDEKARVLEILADGDQYPVVTGSNEQDGFRDVGFQVRVHWLQGLSSPNSRRLIQVVNTRAVRDKLLQQAILAPFRQALLPGQFPAVALIIDVNPAAIDVNVHPTKSEIRFLNNRKVFQTIESVVKGMITRSGAPAVVPIPQMETHTQGMASSEPAQSFGNWANPGWTPPRPYSPPSSYSPPQKSERFDFSPHSPTFSTPPAPTPPLWQASESAQSRTVLTQSTPIDGTRFAGILFNTYIIYEAQSEIILVDQHAAHERIRYEKLKKRMIGSSENPAPLSSQSLLIPETVRFPNEDRTTLENRLSWLSSLGFEAEIFGEDTLLFRAVPGEWGDRQLKPRLKNLVERVLSVDAPENSVILDETLFEALASEACHSAIRAGDHLEPDEVADLIRQLFECEHPWNCPHGRPTVVRVPQGKLEEWFQRRV